MTAPRSFWITLTVILVVFGTAMLGLLTRAEKQPAGTPIVEVGLGAPRDQGSAAGVVSALCLVELADLRARLRAFEERERETRAYWRALHRASLTLRTEHVRSAP